MARTRAWQLSQETLRPAQGLCICCPDRGFIEFTLRDISGWTKRNRKNRKVKADPVDVVMRLKKEGVLDKAGTILVERQMKSRF